MAQESRHWSMQCRDAVGRPGRMLVTVRDDELVVTVPAGETAVFRRDQIPQADRLQRALTLGIVHLREQ